MIITDEDIRYINTTSKVKNYNYMLQFYMNKKDKEAYLIDRLNSDHIGDDAAVIDGNIYSSDAFFEDVHFKREWMSLSQIARKAMLVNFSDAVAMNAVPKYALITISIPKNINSIEIDELMDSFISTAREFNCEIIGGDTIGGEKLHISITVISKSKYPLYRKGLKEGDLLAYTGHIGDSKRDLEKLFLGEKIEANSKFYEPILRDDFITRARPYLHVGMDISDGLFCDSNKLLDINGYGFNILKNINDFIGSSGEEYEMLVGFDSEHLERLQTIAKETHTPLTVFAKVAENEERFLCESHHFNDKSL